jgi:NAD(P)-dependent dehydrogenase (short-subunit alcohol dehydrogenase family)
VSVDVKAEGLPDQARTGQAIEPLVSTSRPDAAGEHRRWQAPLTDVLVNAAASPHDRRADITPEQWQRVIATNLSGVFYMSQAAARNMVEHGGGVIVNISSCNSFIVESPTSITTARAGEPAHAGMALSRPPWRARVACAGMTMADDGLQRPRDLPGHGEDPMRRRPGPETRRTSLFLASDAAISPASRSASTAASCRLLG